MYTIYKGNYLLHDLREKEYILENPTITEELNTITSFDFSINPLHPNYNHLGVLEPDLVIKNGSKTIFRGRIIKEKQNMDKTKQVTCESVLAFLLDTTFAPFAHQGTPLELFQAIIDSHNSQVNDASRQFTIGLTTGAGIDNNDYIYRSNEEYSTSWDAIKDKLLNIGGYIYVDYEDEGLVINWVDDFTATVGDVTGQKVSGQTVEFGENLLDIVAENNAENTYSVVIPLGAKLEDEDGETKSRLTITSVNDDSIYLINQTALAQYGWIVAPTSETTWDDVTTASALKSKGQVFLDNSAVMLKSTLELNAIDLSLLNADMDNIEIGEYIRVKSKPHLGDITKTYLLTKKVTPLTKPENMTITLGEESKSLTGINFEVDRNASELFEKVDIIDKNYVTNADIATITEELQTNLTTIIQDSENIILSALTEYVTTSDYNSFKETVESSLSVLSDEIIANFSSTTEAIETLDEETTTAFRELSAYIRGYMDEEGKPVLELGSSESPIMLKILNDRISFIQSNTEVAYISDSTLYITDGTFLNSLQIGNFAFKPRTSGNLSFVKV